MQLTTSSLGGFFWDPVSTLGIFCFKDISICIENAAIFEDMNKCQGELHKLKIANSVVLLIALKIEKHASLFFWGFWRSFFSLFLGPFFSSSCSQFFATYGSASVKLKIAGLHTLHLNMKNLIFCLKIELQTKPFKNTFFELIFHNLWFRLSQTEVFGGLGG